MRKDCVPDAEIPIKPKTRKYSGPPKGSQEAKDRMAGEATIHYPEGRQHCLPDRLWAARNGLITSELLQLW